MSDYQNYIDNLVKQPLEIKMKSLVAEIRKIWEDNRAALKRFKGVEKDIDGRLKTLDRRLKTCPRLRRN